MVVLTMEMMLWILFCLFASVGLVQCGFWLTEALKRPGAFRRGYHLIPLYDEPGQLEAQLRSLLSRIRRDNCGCEQIIMVDMGLGEECQKICDKLTLGISGMYICEPGAVVETMTKLDNLQNAANDVE